MLEKKGLVKLTEECGELIQIASKKMTRMDSDEHWDGRGSINKRMQEEISDVLAAIEIVIKNFDLNRDEIIDRFCDKFTLFHEWQKGENDVNS